MRSISRRLKSWWSILNLEVPAMPHARTLPFALTFALVGAVACTKQQRAKVDTATGSVESATRRALSVIDIDMGRRLATDSTIADKTDDFAATDTVYASVHTSGTATNGAVVGRWTSPDGAVADEKTNMVTTNGNARTVFRLAKPGGLAKGRYTLHVIIDGKEVRSKDITVK
jgi:hypothetical protein